MFRLNSFKFAVAGIFIIGIAFFTGSCSKKDVKKLIIGATPQPHARILEFVKDDYSKSGYTLEIIEFTDYVTPNAAVLDGSIDANFFQHIPYLEGRPEWAGSLVNAFGVHIEPLALYGPDYKSIDGLNTGARIAVPSDPTNGGRAFMLLAANNIIKLKDDAGLTATDLDITDNPRGFKFIPMDAAALPAALQDVDAACINGNYALQAGLNPVNDSLLLEGSDSLYVNIVVVKKGFETDPRVKALKDVMLTDKVRKFILENWPNGSVVPIF